MLASRIVILKNDKATFVVESVGLIAKEKDFIAIKGLYAFFVGSLAGLQDADISLNGMTLVTFSINM